MFLYLLKKNKIQKTSLDEQVISKYLDRNMSNKKGFNSKIGQTRHYPPATQEWFNSIYLYNKNHIKPIPVVDNIVNNILKSYFNLTPFVSKEILKYEAKPSRSKPTGIRSWRLSSNKIFVSRAEMKHTNNKVIITIYTFNKPKNYFISKLLNLNTDIMLILKKKNSSLSSLYKQLKLKINLLSLKDLKGFLNKKQQRKINFIALKGLSVISNKVRKEKNLLFKTLNWKNYNSFIQYEIQIYEKFIMKTLKKEMLLLYYTQMLSINNYKFKNWFMLGLNSLAAKIYNKKVEFNIVNLKSLHLNSDIFSYAITLKLENRNNRLLRVLKQALKLVKMPSFKKSYLYEKKLDNDQLSHLSLNGYEKNVLNYIKHKSISGVRLEATGRLTRRLTASRSIFKFKYKGGLKNIDSSYKGLSSVMLRGHVKSNLQHTNIKSKISNGAFGLKGWVSSF